MYTTHVRILSLSSTTVPVVIIFSGVLTGACGLIPFLWFFIWVALAPYFYILLSPIHTTSRRQALFYGVLYGLSLNLTVNAASWSAYPLEWVGIASPTLSVLIVGIVSIGSSLCMAVGQTLLALTVFELRSRGWNLLLFFALPLLWIVAEWLQALLFSIYVLGPTSTINAFLQTASIGYIFANPVSEFWMALARWGGLPLLSVFPVVFNLFIALAVLSRPERRTTHRHVLCAAAVVAIFIISSFATGAVAERARGMTPAWKDTERLTVVVGMTNFPAQLIPTTEVLNARNAVIFDIAAELKQRGIQPDVFIVPETVGGDIDANEYRRISSHLPNASLVVHGEYEEAPVQLAFIRSHVIGGDTYITDKQFIMPYGEYPPYHFLAALKLFSPELYATVRENREYRGGTREEMGSTQGVPIGVRACSEVYSPQLYKSLAESGAGLLAQTSSIKIFEGSPYLEWTMRLAARMRAVENGLPIVQSFNAGDPHAFDCQGRELQPDLVTDTFKVFTIARTDACAK
jgi:apolipoprotein N-acyltransferase